MFNNIMRKDYISEIISQNKAIFQSFGVKKLGLFGSMVRDENTENSDIDLLVEFQDGKKTFDNFMDLSFILEDLFDKKIDLVTPESLSDNLKAHIFPEVKYFEV
jgi:uncharacterized protein